MENIWKYRDNFAFDSLIGVLSSTQQSYQNKVSRTELVYLYFNGDILQSTKTVYRIWHYYKISVVIHT